MPLDPSDPTVEAAVFGKEVEHFLTSNIGSYLLQCAMDEKEDAVNALMKTSAADTEAIRQIQLKIAVCQKITKWLANAVNSGIQAAQYLENTK